MKTKLTRSLFKEAWKRGKPIKDIGESLGVSKRTVLYWARQMELPYRRPNYGIGRRTEPAKQ
jgi:hypothetical protein